MKNIYDVNFYFIIKSIFFYNKFNFFLKKNKNNTIIFLKNSKKNNFNFFNFFIYKNNIILNNFNKDASLKILIHGFFFLKEFILSSEPLFFCFKFYKYLNTTINYLNFNLSPERQYYIYVNFVSTNMFVNLAQYLNIFLFQKYQYLFPKKYTNYQYIFEIFYNIFVYKNIKFLVHYIKNIFRNVNFYKHKFLLFFIRAFFKMLNLSVFRKFSINGIYLKFHGKIAKAGNSRKQKMLIQHRRISTCYKNNYLVEKFQINTFTGVVGCTLVLSFN